MQVIKLLNDQGIDYAVEYVDNGDEIKTIFKDGIIKFFPKKLTHENRNYEFNFETKSYQLINK